MSEDVIEGIVVAVNLKDDTVTMKRGHFDLLCSLVEKHEEPTITHKMFGNRIIKSKGN